MRLRSFVASFLFLVGLSLEVPAQWQIPDHTIPIGRGQGFTGFKSAAPGASGQVLQSFGTTSDPAFTNPTIWAAESFGANCDAIRVNSSSVTVGAGSTALTVVGANFLTADVGKVITVQSAGVAAAYHTTTIAARVSATQVTLGVAAVTAVAGVAKEVVYGTDNTAAFVTARTAINAGTVKSFQLRAGTKCVFWPAPAEQEALFDFGNVKGLVFDGAGAELISTNTNPARTNYFMQFTSSSDIEVRGINGYSVADALTPGGATGLNWFYITGFTGTGNDRISIEGNISGGRTFVGANRGFTGVFNTDITVKGKLLNVFYGATNESAIRGHYVTLNTENPGRSLIAYGNPGPTVFHITSKNPLANDVIFTAYGHSTATDWTRVANVKGTYVNTESTTTWPQLYFSHQQNDPAVDSIQTIIENIDIAVDFRFPAVAGNCLAATNDSYVGHSGTAVLGDASGHIERNIRISGSIRGKCTGALFQQGLSANGWTAGTGKVHWQLENLTIADQTAAGITLGRGASTTYINVKAPNTPFPTFEGTPVRYNHTWLNSVFLNAGGAGAAGLVPFSSGNRIVDQLGINVPQMTFEPAGATSIGQLYQLGDIFNIATSGSANRVAVNLATGLVTLGQIGSGLGTLAFANTTSGSITLTPPAGALGSSVLTLPIATDTLMGKATTDTMTNKTFNSSGTGNTLQVSGVTVSRGQFPGTNTNDNATAGNIGDFLSTATTAASNANAAVTMTIASPCVVTWTAHGFAVGAVTTALKFTTTGALPTGVVASTTYYLKAINANTFNIATSADNALAGTFINTSGSQSGVHTADIRIDMASTVRQNLAAMSLPAGDWDVAGQQLVAFGATTTVTWIAGNLATTSAGQDRTFGRRVSFQYGGLVLNANEFTVFAFPPNRFSLSGATTVYLVGEHQFGTSTLTNSGWMTARRPR